MNKPIYCNHIKYLPQTCGVTELGWFRDYEAVINAKAFKLGHIPPQLGAGWYICGFTDTCEEYKEAYLQLCKKYKLVYQSPVRTNTRTGHQFFFCIFDFKVKK